MKKKMPWPCTLILIAGLVGTSGAAAQPELAEAAADGVGEYLRDWSQSPAIQEIDTRQTLYVLGDFHGNMIPVMTALQANGVIAAVPDLSKTDWLAKVKWSAGPSVLVQVGDVITKGPYQVEALRFLIELQRQAAVAGGRVVVVMGNNDARFLSNPLSSGSSDVYNAFEKIQAGLALQVSKGIDAEGIGKWLRNLPVGLRVNGFYFQHNGHTEGLSIPQLEAKLRSVILPPGGTSMKWDDPRLMDEIDDYVEEPGSNPPVYRYGSSLLQMGLPNLDTAASGIEEHPHPYWWHPLYYEPVPVTDGVPGPVATSIPDEPAGSKAILTKLTRALGVEHIVMGHEWKLQLVSVNGQETVLRPRSQLWYHCGSTVLSGCPGLLFFVDVGMNKAYKPETYSFYPPDPKKAYSFLKIASDGRRLSVSVLAENPKANPEFVLYSEVVGDLDLNGKVEGNDLTLLRKATGARRGDTLYDRRADIDNDGRVDAYDLLHWMQVYSFGTPAAPTPAPAPTWGLGR